MTDFSHAESQEIAADTEGDVERDGGSSSVRFSEESLDALSPDDARSLNDEIGIPGTQAIGGLAGDAD